jgi:DNA polymerase III subunit gamma/tau
MLSTGAFNALLKTLEEPPDHVKFILATTEIDKVPETIRSRSLRFDFKKISETDIVKRLEYVCQQEGIKAEKEALDIIARAARGALRDALTLTEQNTVHQEISTEYVRSTLSLIEDSLIDGIIDTILEYDKEKMITILDTLRNRHAEVRGLFDQIMYGLRDRMVDGFANKNTTSFTVYSSIFAIFESAYGRIRSIPDGWLLIEITLMRALAREEMKNTDKKVSKEENSRMGARGEDTVQNFRQKISSGDENSSMMSGANI